MNSGRVALTFDAEHPSRPHCAPGVVDLLLDALARSATPATFFVQGRWATAYPATARRVADAGHLIGNHSNHHAPLPFLSDEGIRCDVGEAEDRIRMTTGVDPRPWFRCPFGRGADDPRVLSALQALGYRHIGWNVDPADWEEAKPAPDVEREVFDSVTGHGDGAIVLLHTWPETTARALPGMVARIRDRGFDFVTVDQVSDER